MRFLALAGTLALTGLAACSSGSGARGAFETGVGFGDYQTYLRARSQGLNEGIQAASSGRPYSVPPETTRGRITPPATMPPVQPSTLDAVPVRSLPAPAPMPPAALPPAPVPATVPAPLAAAPQPAALASTVLPATAPVQPAGQPLSVMAPRPVQPASPATGAGITAVAAGPGFGTTPAFDAGPNARGISDEQSFEAVSARETIESDRERLARQREQYQVIQVSSVPGAEVSGGPNLVAFALATTHAPGTETYRRINPLRWGSWQDNCLAFRTQEAAQEAFLSAGGPERDRDNLDPDGDGYACWWDPTPIRQAMARN